MLRNLHLFFIKTHGKIFISPSKKIQLAKLTSIYKSPTKLNS